MSIENIISVVIIVLAAGLAIGLRIYTLKKNNKKITFNDFINHYADNIINVLKDSVKTLMIKLDNFDSREAYEKAIIENTVESIRSNYESLGITLECIDSITNKEMTNIVYNLLHKNYKQVFADISIEIISNYSNLYDTETLFVDEPAPIEESEIIENEELDTIAEDVDNEYTEEAQFAIVTDDDIVKVNEDIIVNNVTEATESAPPKDDLDSHFE